MMITPTMKQIEEKEGKPITEILIELYNEHGTQTAVAAALGINQSTLNRWLLYLSLEQKTVLVPLEREEKAS